MLEWLARCVFAVGVVVAGRLVAVAPGLRQPASNRAAIRALSQARPDVRWKGTFVLTGDFDCDGRPDHVRLGRASARAFVGLAHGEEGNLKADTLDFAIDPSQQAAICAEPAKLAVEPLDGELVSRVSGRRPPKTCKGIRLSGGECDAIHIFWNPQANHLGWVRD